MRIAVTGRNGQVARALAAAAGLGHQLEFLGQPDFDLERPETIRAAVRAARPDIVINAAAWTAVDLAESEPGRVFTVNAAGAGHVAAAAHEAGAAVIQLSTDYVFDGTKPSAYAEDDPVNPLGVYGTSKLAGERAVADANSRHVILRLQWVYAPWGKNFLLTMLRLADTRDEVAVVADQSGRPTYAPDIAAALLRIADRLAAGPDDPALHGVFHLAAGGSATSWAGFAEAIFAARAAHGERSVRVRPITTADYPTPARRPVNGVLDGGKLTLHYGISLPDWRDGITRCMATLATAHDNRSGAQDR